MLLDSIRFNQGTVVFMDCCENNESTSNVFSRSRIVTTKQPKALKEDGYRRKDDEQSYFSPLLSPLCLYIKRVAPIENDLQAFLGKA